MAINRPDLPRTPNYDIAFDMFGDRLILKLKEILNKKGINATGQLSDSFQKADNGASVVFEGYGQIVDDGRNKSAKMPPVKPIQDWIRARGIRPRMGQSVEQLSFAIAKGIQKRGYRPQPFIQPAISEVEQQMAPIFADAIADDIELNAQTYFDNNVNNKEFILEL